LLQWTDMNKKENKMSRTYEMWQFFKHGMN
jgi:hypothetical protein